MRDRRIKSDQWRQLPVNYRPGLAPLSENRLIRIKTIMDDSLARFGQNATMYRVDWESGADVGQIRSLIEIYQKQCQKSGTKLHYVLAIEKSGEQDCHFHVVFIFDKTAINIENTIKKKWNEISGNGSLLNLVASNPEHSRTFDISCEYEIAFYVASYLSKIKTIPHKDEAPNSFISSHLRLITHFEWISTSRNR